MSLPSTERLSAVRAEEWARLAERFRSVGFTSEYVRASESGAATMPEPVRSRWIRHHHRSQAHPASYAVRLFALGDAVPGPEVAELFGEGPMDLVREAGLVVPAGEAWTSPFRLEIVNHLYVFADQGLRGEDSVMPVGESTLLLAQASYPQADVGDALDLGCGSGVLALLLSGAARRVVATDANPRALELARFNCAVNGVRNVELRLGDLFDPVAGERFDLVVSQPPFCSRPPGTEPVLFLHGGPRGDEVTRRVLARLASHLAPGGCGFVLSDFPSDDGDSLAADLRAEVGEGRVGLLVLTLADPAPAETQCALLAAAREPEDDDAFSRELELLCAHFARLGISRVRQAVVVLANNGDGNGWTRELEVPAESWRSLHRTTVDRALLAAGGDPVSPGA